MLVRPITLHKTLLCVYSEACHGRPRELSSGGPYLAQTQGSECDKLWVSNFFVRHILLLYPTDIIKLGCKNTTHKYKLKLIGS